MPSPKKLVRRALAPILVLATVLVAVLACRPPAPPASTLPEDAPRLVLFLVVDQMRADYLVRFRSLYTGGLKRLLEESVVFTDARHDHALTTTSPGHATLSTGAHPARHGIIDNYWFDRQEDDRVYSVENSAGERTPERLLAPAFGDWLKAAAPEAKVFAASAKDRAAILTAGLRPDAAFWYDRGDGTFTGADETERPWLETFDDEHNPSHLFPTAWEPLPEVVEVAPEYGVMPLDRGLINPQLPHPLGGFDLHPDAGFYRDVYGSPFVDAYLAEFAQALIDGEGLGQDAVTDFLGLSFSALDSVGHTYGPSSPEVLDTLLRLDRDLGELLDFVDRRIGLENVVVSLSADHGVTPIPEYLVDEGGRRFGAAEVGCVQRVGRALEERFGDGPWLRGGLVFDAELAAERGVALEELEDFARQGLEACPGVARVWTRSELLKGAAEGDETATLFAHTFHPERSPDLLVQLEPHVLPSYGSETTHGSPYPYDTAVPWLLRLPEGRPLEVGERVHTVDVAPTLAALVGISPTAPVDGVDRRGLFTP